MKVTVENIIAGSVLEGDIDIEGISSTLEGARFQPEVMDGLIYELTDPRADIFLLRNGVLKLHGITSKDDLTVAVKGFLSVLSAKGFKLKHKGPLSIQEIIASVKLERRLSPKDIYDEFKKDGIHYDPNELPGFHLNIGSSGIEILIFPEGKIISRGATDISDAVSSLEMVMGRLS